MPSKRAERTITISGKNGYVQLLPEEQKAIRIEIYFTATNVGETNYYSYEWYKERTLYGRVKIARGEYTTKEKLIQYQNELLYSEEATMFEIVKRLQCQNQKQYEVNKFIVESLISIANQNNIVLSVLLGTTAFTQIPPQPIEIPGLQVDGLYYNMFPGCAGRIVLQTWYDDDLCKDVNNKDLTKDNRGDPPEPAFPGRPPAGSDTDVPPPTFDPGGTYKDPTPGSDVPTDSLSNPERENGNAGTFYVVTFRDYFTRSGETRAIATMVILGKYGGLVRKEINNGTSISFGINTAIGVPGQTQPLYREFVSTGKEPDGTTTVTISIISIVPQ